MNQVDVHTGWQELCKEHDAARDAYFQAYAAVNHKFSAIGQRASATNPTDDELSEFEKTWQTWEDVKMRMDAFVKRYT